jgi:pSer/pThr/pTyr-binding forkhead associated (FHA) protein
MKCRDGHDSTASDFCSECGLEMPAVARPDEDTALEAARLAAESCPACATERDDPASPFCGVCGYNFATRQGGHVVPPAPRPAPRSVAPAPRRTAPVKPLTAATSQVEIAVTFDDSNPDAPKGVPARKFSLYDEDNLLGRRSSSVAQTVGLDGDDAISRRHLLIMRQRGGYVARLFDNTNGGTHNGVPMTSGVEVPLAVGDRLAIGSFTIVEVTTIR